MIGQQIGNYKITSQIGEGGMGAVYAAKHAMLDKLVAVKVLLPKLSNDEELVNRFFNEAKATSAIKDPGIVELYDFGHLANGSAYIVMELLTGEGMDVRIARTGRIPFADAARLTRRIANVLSAAHGHGIVHRDLKPENVFLVPDSAVDGGERPKVLDFGIAKLGGGLASTTSNVKTRTGAIIGSPLYMAPEQCKGAGKVDHRADIYSLGCMLFELLCGVPPFEGEGAGEVLAAHIHVDPPNPQRLESSIPAGLTNVVLRALAKDPEKRFTSMAEFSRSLQRFCVPTLDGGNAKIAPTEIFEVAMPQDTPFPAGTLNAGAEAKPDEEERLAVGSLHGDGQAMPGGQPPGRTITPTTLGGASIESTVKVAAPSSRNGMWLALAAALLVGGGLTYALLGADDTSPAIATEPSPVEPVQVPEPVIPEEPAPPSTEVTVRIVSDPNAAAVYNSAGTLLGATPYVYSGQRSEEQVELTLKHEGYRDRPIRFALDQDHEKDVLLLAKAVAKGMTKAEKRRAERLKKEEEREAAEMGRVTAEHGRSAAEIERQKAEAERQARRRAEREAKAKARRDAKSGSDRVGDGAL